MMETSFADRPGQTEFALDAETVRALICQQFPTLDVGSVQYLHEGWDSAAYLVDRKWVFRFPKRRERMPQFQSELMLLGLLNSRRLPVDIPVPVHVGQAGPLFPCGFMGYRLLMGTQGDRFDAHRVDRPRTAQRLGQVLSEVHSLDPAELAARGVSTYESSLEDVLAETMAMRETVLPQLPGELETHCRPFLEGTCAIPGPSPLGRCLVHGDLCDEHLLLDDSGCVSGIIDWGDACLADPTLDFAGLYAWLGEEFVERVLENYRAPHHSVLMEQIVFRARCAALTTYGWSLQGHGTSPADRLNMVRTAFHIQVVP